jgi:endonuclease-3
VSISPRRVQAIVSELREAYGEPRHPRHLPPVDELVMTILSQNTSDTNTERSFAALRAAYPAWDEVMGAAEGDLVDVLRSGGLANQKAPRIQAVLRTLHAEPHGFDLRWLGDLPPEQAQEWLTALPGVGPKTAACVLLFSLDVPVMPVDTHVHRVSRRLGLIGDRVSADAAHAILTEMTPDGEMLSAHLLLIEHGRRTCRARNPRCGECVLARDCPSAVVPGPAPDSGADTGTGSGSVPE